MYLFTIQIDSYTPTMKPSAACGAPRHPPRWHKLGPRGDDLKRFVGKLVGQEEDRTMEAFLVGKNCILIWLVVGPPL